jgi:hypothetical protein
LAKAIALLLLRLRWRAYPTALKSPREKKGDKGDKVDPGEPPKGEKVDPGPPGPPVKIISRVMRPGRDHDQCLLLPARSVPIRLCRLPMVPAMKLEAWRTLEARRSGSAMRQLVDCRMSTSSASRRALVAAGFCRGACRSRWRRHSASTDQGSQFTSLLHRRPGRAPATPAQWVRNSLRATSEHAAPLTSGLGIPRDQTDPELPQFSPRISVRPRTTRVLKADTGLLASGGRAWPQMDQKSCHWW